MEGSEEGKKFKERQRVESWRLKLLVQGRRSEWKIATNQSDN